MEMEAGTKKIAQGLERVEIRQKAVTGAPALSDSIFSRERDRERPKKPDTLKQGIMH